MHIQESRIRLLPEHVIDQIKAGEVVERPAHILKELIENSLDAGSTKIEISILNNGLDLIHIKDNGNGMDFNELPMAFCRHATSKLERFDDIYNLGTFGFRGEALASLASVSKLTCQSSPLNGQAGKIQMEGPVITNHVQLEQDSSGTEIFVKELFYNTPARLKFINSSRAEKNFLKKVLFSYFIANPDVEFSFKQDDEDRLILPRKTTDGYLERVNLLLESDKRKWMHAKNLYGAYELMAFVSESKAKSKLQYIFVNGRPIYDKQIHAMMQNLTTSLSAENQTGHFLIFINAHPASIDVNIHPHKTQIKFENNSEIMALVRTVVKNCFEDASKKEVSGITEKLSPPRQENLLSDFETIKDLKKTDLYPVAHHIEAITKEQSEETLSKISDFYYLRKSNDTFSILSLPRLLKYLFEANRKSQSPTTPLLISIPIRSQKSISGEEIEKLESAGFMIDSISDKQYLVREIPTCFSTLHLQEFITQMFASKHSFDTFFTKEDCFGPLCSCINLREFSELLKQIPAEELFPTKIQIPLDNYHIGKIVQ